MAGALDGRVAVVTGAASGMGRVMATSLTAAGAAVTVADIDRTRLADLAGPEVLAIVADVAEPDDCRRIVEETVGRFGRLDILINCAGISLVPITPPGHQGALRLWEVTPQGWARIHAINNVGAFAMAHYAAQPMMRQGWGRIVNVTTSFDTMLAPGFSPYGSSKAALEAATAAWAKELAPFGVTANVLIPGGPTATPFLPADARARPGVLQPDIMAVPVVWLASPQSDGVTGHRFVARDWDPSLPPHEAAARARAPAAWPEAAAAASASRGMASTE